MQDMKACSKCGVILPLALFFKDKSKKGGYCNKCKNCCKAYDKTEQGIARFSKWRNSGHGKAKTKEYNDLPSSRKKRAEWEKTEAGKKAVAKYRGKIQYKVQTTDRVLRDRFGLSLDEFNKMLISQNGVCAICGKVNTNGRRLAVDHDHETLKIRALLCHKCNLALGLLDENVSVFKNCIEYIEKHKNEK